MSVGCQMDIQPVTLTCVYVYWLYSVCSVVFHDISLHFAYQIPDEWNRNGIYFREVIQPSCQSRSHTQVDTSNPITHAFFKAYKGHQVQII
jgi:hypothetical protein